MECLSCVKSCPESAISVEKYSCLKIERKNPLKIDREKCNDCGVCVSVCPLNDIGLSKLDCNFCIICKSRPNCIKPKSGRDSLKSFIISIFRLLGGIY